MTTIEEQWRELEAEPGGVAWRLLLARPHKGYPLHVALDGRTRRRALLLRAPAESIPSRRQWPTCRGLVLFTETVNGQPHCGVALKEARFADVFAALAEDLARRVSETTKAEEAVRTLFGQLARWQKFLTSSGEGLGDEEERGLWGELHCLREWLLPAFERVGEALAGWKGGERAHQDFQFARGALEVKTTIAKQPQAVRIASECQLDEAPWPALFLHVLVLEVREGAPETLPAIVGNLRAALFGAEPSTREAFEDGLLAAGYLDGHAPRYAGRGYTVRAAHWFRVRGRFPRLVEAALPPGVGDANYALSVAACMPFAIEPAQALAVLTGSSFSKKRRKREQ